MVCAQVIGNHTTITIAGLSGNFEINVMMPVSSYNLLQSIYFLSSASRNFTVQCIKGIKAQQRDRRWSNAVWRSAPPWPLSSVTMPPPHLQRGRENGQNVREVSREKTNLTEAELDRILDPASMTKPGMDGGPAGG